MILTDDQLNEYSHNGFFLIRDVFDADELQLMAAQASAEFAVEGPRRVMETNGRQVRAVHGSHLHSRFFADLVRMPRLLDPVRQLLSGEAYVHQFKINAKKAFGGELWEWHQDFYFWEHEDGMSEPRAVNVVIHLDAANEFNGPLMLIPGSHRETGISAEGNPVEPDGEVQGWERTVSARLKYRIGSETLRKLVDTHGITSIKGTAGCILFFDPRVVHGSVGNMTPYDRSLLIISYNSTENQLREVPHPRPEFLAGREYGALKSLARDRLPGTGY
ncbi:phytanoyl-CoA dioxygenase family protein [Streptomyces sp. NPDC050287]|uniref:phytanoyl-CoA dioxygenase family protein n=1 Tax=Streptomyces sp. NPDC050287 TaxID=3365608 RepID=UPI0037B920BC